MPSSALEEFRRTYGDRLRAELAGTQSALGSNPAPLTGPQMRSPLEDQGPGAGPYVPPEDPTQPQEPGGTNDPEGGEDMGGPMAMEQGSADGSGSALNKKGYTFRDMYKDAPDSTKQQQLTKLEAALKQGNQTIDSAYDDLEKQLGTRPEKKKLSKQEKGMLLMEFGLNVLANNKKGFGAIGMAGGQALKSYNDVATGPQKRYDATRGSIEAARAGSKVKLAEGSALESIKQPASVASKLPGKFVGDDGYVYFYDENNKVQQAKDEAGKPIKAAQAERLGEHGKEFESDSKYNRYMEIYGKDPRTGEPLTGLALQRAKQDALDFSNDRGKTQDDLDLDLEAARQADSFINSNHELFRDMTPDQVNEYRNKLVTERRSKMQRKPRSYLETPEPTRGHPTTVRKYSSLEEAKDAFRRKEIHPGDRISVNGVEDTVE